MQVINAPCSSSCTTTHRYNRLMNILLELNASNFITARFFETGHCPVLSTSISLIFRASHISVKSFLVVHIFENRPSVYSDQIHVRMSEANPGIFAGKKEGRNRPTGRLGELSKIPAIRNPESR